MAFPIDPKDQGSLKQLDNELEQYIKQAQQGKEDKQAIFKIEKELKALANNQNIPSSVRQSLKNALESLKSDKSGVFDLTSVISAKMEIDQVIGGSPSMPEEKK